MSKIAARNQAAQFATCCLALSLSYAVVLSLSEGVYAAMGASSEVRALTSVVSTGALVVLAMASTWRPSWLGPRTATFGCAGLLALGAVGVLVGFFGGGTLPGTVGLTFLFMAGSFSILLVKAGCVSMKPQAILGCVFASFLLGHVWSYAFSFLGPLATLVACIAITEKDVPGSFPKKANGKSVNFIDMFRLLTGNRAMQMYVIAGVSDKIASQVVRQAAISTLVFGIVIGNYEFSGTFSLIKILPTILLLFYGSHLAGKYGTKKALVQWSAISIVCAVLMIGFMAVIDPTSVSINPVTTGLFIVLYLAYMCCSNVVSSCTNAMVPDIVDYELYRTGSFLPGTVGTLYSLIDELISSSADTILALCLTLIGYVSVQPQPGDACTSSVFWMTMFLWMGLPILGWLCTLIAMKWYPLDKEKMAEVQEKNAAFRAAQKDQREANAK